MKAAAAFWLVVCAGLVAVVAYQLSSSFPLAPTVTAAPPGASSLDLPERPGPPRPPDAHALDLIAARPLFSESRRPHEAPAALPQEVAPEPAEAPVALELAGTYLAGTDQAALLAVSGGSPAWLRKGDQIEGWQIAAIAQDRVELRKGGRQQVLWLRDDSAVSRTGRAAGRGDARARPSEPAADDEDEDEATPQ